MFVPRFSEGKTWWLIWDKVNTYIIILEVSIEEEVTMIGALVDSVKEVINLDTDTIEPPPKIGTQLKTEFIKGMGKQNEEFVIILEIEQIFSSDELEFLQDTAEAPAA